MSPWSASTGERNPARIPREIRVWEIFWDTKPDLPTPVKKIVPLQFNRVWVKVRVWERFRFWKKWLRYFCWDLKRWRRSVGSIRVCFEGRERSADGGGRDPIVFGFSLLCVFLERERRERGV